MRSLPSSWNNTLTRLGFKRRKNRRTKPPKSHRGKKLGLEALEERRVLATITVTDNSDGSLASLAGDGEISLREAIHAANTNSSVDGSVAGEIGADTIVFAANLSGGTLIMDRTQGQFVIDESLTIDASSLTDRLTIDADDPTLEHNGDGIRVFHVEDSSNGVNPPEFEINSLRLINADRNDPNSSDGYGGAIQSEGLLTIRNSVFEDNGGFNGGAIFIDLNHSSLPSSEILTVEDSYFINNSSGNQGGAIFASTQDTSSEIRIDNSVFTLNQAEEFGGGAYLEYDIANGDYSGSPNSGIFVSDTTFDTNSAREGGGAFISLGRRADDSHNVAEEALLDMQRSLISGNTAENRGGGLYLYGAGGSELLIQDSRITGNRTGEDRINGQGESPFSGGGVYAYMVSGPLGQFSSGSNPSNPDNDNPALVARLTIAGTTIDTNVAGDHGGGVFICTKRGGNLSSEFGIYNSTVSGNTAGQTTMPIQVDGTGGGIHLAVWPGPEDEGLVSEFRNVTVTGNIAGSGGGIYSEDPSFSQSIVDTRLTNTIVSGNNDHDAVGSNFYGSINAATSQFNLFGPDASNTFLQHDPSNGTTLAFNDLGIGNIKDLDNDPDLQPLADNRGVPLPDGSSVPTHETEYDGQAQDSGSNALAVEPFSATPLLADQRGANRYVDIPLVGGTTPEFTVDIGAHECDPNFLPGDYNSDGFVDAADYSVWRDNLGATVVPFSGADGNGNGSIDVADYHVWRSHYGALPGDSCHLDDVPLPGDYNNDGIVNAADYSVWRDNLGSSIVLPNDTTPGTVTVEDYDVWRNNYGATSSPPAVASVPGDYDRNGSVDDADYNVWLTNLGSEADLYADGNENGIIDMADLAVWQEYRGVTTVDDFSGDYNGNGVVDQADYQLWSSTYGSTTELAADGNGDGTVDAADYTVWRDNLGTTNAAVFPTFLNGGTPGVPLEVPMAAPQVVEVSLSGSSSVHPEFDFSTVDGSGEQLRSVPVGIVDTLSVQFSEEVFVLNSDLALVNAQSGTSVVVSTYSYDLANQTAIWQLASPLDPGQYLVTLADSIIDLDWDALDGEYSNPWSLTDPAGTSSTLPSGDGEAGGEFRFRFTILDGDYNGDNVADAADYTVWADNNGLTGAISTRQGDGNGSGTVDSADLDVWTSQYGANYVNWPSVEPGTILVSTLTDEDDGDHTLGDLSLREALGITATQSGADRIEFQHSLSGGTLALGLGELVVGSDVTIAGLGADDLTISGANSSRIFNVSSGVNVTISDLTLTDGNAASANGGAILSSGDLNLDQVVVSNSTAYTGGGIYLTTGSFTMQDSSILDNTASFAGGGLTLYSAALSRVESSTVAQNDSTYVGGIYVYQTELELANVTISGNAATNGFGGGLYVSAGSATTAELTNVTVTDNDAGTGAGGGVYVGSANVTTTMVNSIVAENTKGGTTADDVIGAFGAGSGNNLIGAIDGSSGLAEPNTQSGTAASPLDPMLAPLGDYGGPTLTHRLLPGSPAIDAGNNAYAVDSLGNALTSDQRGFNRFVNTVDIGAVEQELLGDYNADGSVDIADYTVWRDRLGSTTDLVADGDGNGIVDVNDYQIWRDHYGSSANGTPLSALYEIHIVSSATDEQDGTHTFGNLSLREALDLADATSGDDMIVFRQELSGQTITLDSALGQLSVDSDINLVGLGADQLTVSGNNAVRVFSVASGVTASISDMSITNGNSANEGGGIYSVGDLTLDSVSVQNNSASTGAGIYQTGGSLTIEHSSIDSNTASFAGGGIVVSGVDDVDITSSTLSRNQATYVGGIWSDNAGIDLVNTTISTNTASSGFGGGAYFYATSSTPRSVTLTNATVANNSGGSGTGGGIYVNGAYVNVLLNNTLIAGNTSSLGADDVYGSFDSLSAYNLIGATDGSTGLGATSNLTGTRAAVLDAGLTALGDHGGATETHALLDGSSAIDAGDDSLASALGITSDQRGEDRFEDGDDDGFDRIDIGAFELAADEFFGTL